MIWFKRFTFASIPVIVFGAYIGEFPLLMAGSYYLGLWIILWSKDNSGSLRGGGHPDQLGGPF